MQDLGRGASLPAAIIGIRSPTIEDPERWRDRAALIEDGWRDASRPLALPWDAEPSAPTGLVVFNSADILSGCRVAVSQVELGSGTSGSTIERPNLADAEGNTQRPRCDQGSAEPPLTLDLVDAFGSCPLGTDWATSAMLSARFPVVTPGGIVDRSEFCGGTATGDRDRLHLVDGGYAENSGIGLLADLAPDLSRIVTEYNSTRRGDGALVVPYLVYIQNSPGAYLAPRAQESVPELAVPAAGFGTKATQVTPNTWIQRAMASLGELCLPGDAACAAEVAPLADPPRPELATSTRVIIAAAGTEPSVTVPLGWGLSDATVDQLLAAARAQASSETCAVPAWSEYRCVGELLALFD